MTVDLRFLLRAATLVVLVLVFAGLSRRAVLVRLNRPHDLRDALFDGALHHPAWPHAERDKPTTHVPAPYSGAIQRQPGVTAT